MYIYPDIVARFSCVCCGTCCSNEWLVTVDEETFRRNERHFAAKGRQSEFTAAFSPLRAGGPGEFAAIAKQAGGSCWFLTGEKLCRLQLEAGHDHLDTVCRIFPRYPLTTDRGTEIALSFACPQVVALAAATDRLDMVRADETPTALSEDGAVAGVFPRQQSPANPLRYYFELEHHFIDIVQCRGLALADRLALLAATAHRLAGLAGNSEALGGQVNGLIYANYDRLDAAGQPADEPGPAERFLEHYFVNLIFKKVFYLHGLRPAARLLTSFWRQLADRRATAVDAAADWETTRRTVMELEFKYGHHRQALLASIDAWPSAENKILPGL